MPNWKEVLAEIKRRQNLAALAVDGVRHDYLGQLHQLTHRNIIAYYSGFLSKPSLPMAEINDEDKNGFMMAVHGMDRAIGLDLILHTPGGDIAATESLVHYLRKMFGKDIRAIVPQIAMSAGTMLACSCHEILMARHANLGPMDPHLAGRPAFGIIAEFKRALKEIKKDPAALAVWQPIIAQYPPTLLSRCQNAIRWSNDFVREQLEQVMFDGEPDAAQKAARIVKKLTDYSRNRAHQRHIHFDECAAIGLKVKLIEDDQHLQDLVLTVHHCYMHSLTNTAAFKIIENHLGNAFVKQQVQVHIPP